MASSIGIDTIKAVYRRLKALNLGSCFSTSYGMSVALSGVDAPARDAGILGIVLGILEGCEFGRGSGGNASVGDFDDTFAGDGEPSAGCGGGSDLMECC